MSGLSSGWAVKAVMLNGADITDVPTVFTKEHDGQLQVVLGSRLSTLEGEVRDDTGKTVDDAMVYRLLGRPDGRGRWPRRGPSSATFARTAGSGSEA